MPDLADVNAAADQLGARLVDVIDHEVQAVQRASGVRDAPPEPDRRRGLRGRELDDPRAFVEREVGIEAPVQALVEGLGAVHVRDRQHRHLQPLWRGRWTGSLDGVVGLGLRAHVCLLGFGPTEGPRCSTRSHP
jgi:hypothetical protein